MAVNPFFEEHAYTGEINLLEDLIIEMIQQYGKEMMYLPRRHSNFDPLGGTDDQAYFDTAYPIEMYITSFDGFTGDRDFMGKFGITEIHDQIKLTVARRRFELEIGAKENIPAPKEKDLIYFPMNKKLFQIMYADNKPFFYQLGNLQVFEITLENFEYASESFSVGIPYLDQIQPRHSQDVTDFALVDQNGDYLVDHNGDIVVTEGYQNMLDLEPSDNEYIQDQVDTGDIIDFSENNPYSERNPY